MSYDINCVYSIDDGGYCTKHSNAFYDASCYLLDGKPCEDQKPLKPVTNADRIRAMSDEELALYLHNLEAQAINVGRADMQPESVETWLDWLKQEVAESDD